MGEMGSGPDGLARERALCAQAVKEIGEGIADGTYLRLGGYALEMAARESLGNWERRLADADRALAPARAVYSVSLHGGSQINGMTMANGLTRAEAEGSAAKWREMDAADPKPLGHPRHITEVVIRAEGAGEGEDWQRPVRAEVTHDDILGVIEWWLTDDIGADCFTEGRYLTEVNRHGDVISVVAVDGGRWVISATREEV